MPPGPPTIIALPGCMKERGAGSNEPTGAGASVRRERFGARDCWSKPPIIERICACGPSCGSQGGARDEKAYKRRGTPAVLTAAGAARERVATQRSVHRRALPDAEADRKIDPTSPGSRQHRQQPGLPAGPFRTTTARVMWSLSGTNPRILLIYGRESARNLSTTRDTRPFAGGPAPRLRSRPNEVQMPHPARTANSPDEA